MSQTISVISGLDGYEAPAGRSIVLGGRVLTPVSIGAAPAQEDPHSASWAVRALQKARENIVKEWNDGWTLKAIAYNQALAATSKRDAALYANAQKQWVESTTIQKKAADEMVVNDTLRSRLYDEVRGKLSLTQDATAWFTQPAGLSVPAAYNASLGGRPIPIFPVYQ